MESISMGLIYQNDKGPEMFSLGSLESAGRISRSLSQYENIIIFSLGTHGLLKQSRIKTKFEPYLLVNVIKIRSNTR